MSIVFADNGLVRSDLPELSRQEFSERLRRCSERSVSESEVRRLYLHYSELRSWNRRFSLVGPGTAEDVVERHYGESLAALALLRPGIRTLVDVGSGAGFPGLVLAIVRPDLDVILIESRQHKWSFLMSACRKASLSCRCLNARVGAGPVEGLPPRIDTVTTRAVAIKDLGLEDLLPRLASNGTILLWSGAAHPQLPVGLCTARQKRIVGSRRRRIFEIVRSGALHVS